MRAVDYELWSKGKPGDEQAVLFKLNEREKLQLCGLRLSGQTIHLWKGSAYDSWNAWGAPKRSTDFPSPEHARTAWSEQRSKKKASGWKEITRRNYEFYSLGMPVVLDYRLQVTLGLAEDTPRGAPRKPVFVDHGAILSRVASGRAKSLPGRPTSSIERRKLRGTLVLPSGKVVAVDPFHLDSDARAFDRGVPPGSYPVELALVSGKVVAATIRIRASAPTRWELAIPRGMRSLVPPRQRDVRVPPAVGCAVDVATAAFMDETTLTSLADDDRCGQIRPPKGMGGVQTFGKSGSAAIFNTSADGTYGVYFGMKDTSIVCVTMYMESR